MSTVTCEGALYDLTGSYDVPFGVNGLLIAISGAIIYLYYCMPAYRRRCKVVAAEARQKEEEKKAKGQAGICCN